MNEDRITPEIGKTCPALTKENYEYHLSGDAYSEYNKCMLNGKTCIGVVVDDPDDQSSQFFSRGRAFIDTKKIKNCPIYGASKEIIKKIVEERAQSELNDKLKNLE